MAGLVPAIHLLRASGNSVVPRFRGDERAIASNQSLGVSRLWRRAEVLLEERDGAAPGEIGRRLVVTVAGVVVERMIDVRIDVDGELLARRLQRRLVGGNPRIDALIEPGIVQQQRRPD